MIPQTQKTKLKTKNINFRTQNTEFRTTAQNKVGAYNANIISASRGTRSPGKKMKAFI